MSPRDPAEAQYGINDWDGARCHVRPSPSHSPVLIRSPSLRRSTGDYRILLTPTVYYGKEPRGQARNKIQSPFLFALLDNFGFLPLSS
ncbi:hypothetical protein XENTR_v10017320 [Xenopus tropicalis]|nr:hypothetical protein XENTR_v10017320 [Xenopus tropicalis]